MTEGEERGQKEEEEAVEEVVFLEVCFSRFFVLYCIVLHLSPVLNPFPFLATPSPSSLPHNVTVNSPHRVSHYRPRRRRRDCLLLH